MERSSGILLHIASLPGAFGIGDFGEGAYAFLDFLEASGQTFWQILPLGVTGFGDSPYQSFSAFAGNPYFIDLKALQREAYLTKSELKAARFKKEDRPIDYPHLYTVKMALLRKAFQRAEVPLRHELDIFFERERYWLDDFSTFMALKDAHNGVMWREWPTCYLKHDTEAVFKFKQDYSEEIRFWIFTQYLFATQWFKLKGIANDKGIKIIGDLPIYVAEDSSDVWGNPRAFKMNLEGVPQAVSGCPPDAFSETGQLWGNPIYDWEYMAQTNYDWWVRRFEYSFTYFDKVRIDHFRGFQAYWEIPFGDETAENGVWTKGPGKAFFDRVFEQTGPLDIIAEDLGILTEDVTELRQSLGFPGMKILQFAFSTDEVSTYLPHFYTEEDVVYTGTHDNHTIMGWYRATHRASRKFAKQYLNLNRAEGIHWGFIRSLMASSAGIVIIPMQDYLGLDDSARMNFPSTIGNNWRVRIPQKAYTKALAKQIQAVTKLYFRALK